MLAKFSIVDHIENMSTKRAKIKLFHFKSMKELVFFLDRKVKLHYSIFFDMAYIRIVISKLLCKYRSIWRFCLRAALFYLFCYSNSRRLFLSWGVFSTRKCWARLLSSITRMYTLNWSGSANHSRIWCSWQIYQFSKIDRF